ncbi:MAG: GHKL domain-containing protein, partial [Sedimentisphaerales bacterium]|nr:GHKL domain-containing protein [Sedimentisphaerales bacterium]
MKIKDKGNAANDRMRWVVLLLAVAVILPTICLLWFMNQAVKNEHLAVKQKLTDAYNSQLELIRDRFDNLWAAQITELEQQVSLQQKPPEMFESFIGRTGSIDSSRMCDAIIVFDGDGKMNYPVLGGNEQAPESMELLDEAWNLEFNDKKYDKAIQIYEQIAESLVDEYTRCYALTAQVRCLNKSGEIEKAIALCRNIAYGKKSVENESTSVLIAQSRILLVKLKQKSDEGLTLADCRELIDSAIDYSAASGENFMPLPSATRIFLLREALEIARESQWTKELQPQISKAQNLLSAEELAVSFLEKYYADIVSETWSEENVSKLLSSLSALLQTIETTIEESEWGWSEQLKRQISTVLNLQKTASQRTEIATSVTIFDNWPQDSFQSLNLPQKTFGIYHEVAGKKYLLLQKAENFGSDFDLCKEQSKKSDISYRLIDNFDKFVCGLENPETEAFLESPFGKYFRGWSIEIHFKDAGIFEKAARKQALFYIWGGLLAICVIVGAGLLTIQAVGKQIKTNKLKNDFIATVSHELKTPLASMRVLVDTLLEGNYRDQKQVTEYLQMTSQENERLSRLIDNFLSFSRMERNKQAFEFTKTNPAIIAKTAAEAVQTKFAGGQCDFKVSIGDNLPCITADRDAMVTVLVNLLDNAYKYSYDNKRIELKVYSENGEVCFAVSDNGIGMSNRSIKKIFNRFYQIDRSLSRRAEGCGLGLSIAKFIIDAHKGSISVDSKP